MRFAPICAIVAPGFAINLVPSNLKAVGLAMFIDSEELARRKEESNNLTERMKVPSEPTVREIPFDSTRFHPSGIARNNDAARTLEEKAVIGVTAIALGNKQAAEIFDVSPEYANVVKRGIAGGASPEDREIRSKKLKEMIYEGLQIIREKSSEKLLMALDNINEASLAAIKASEKAKVSANIANQLSSVIDRTIDKGEGLLDAGRTSHLHLYAPESRPLTSFTIKRINVGESSTDEGKSNAISSIE